MCSQSVKKTLPWWQKPLVGIVWVLMLGICNLSVAQTENEGNEIDISFSEVSETQIVGESSQLGIKLSATRENDNDVVSIQLSDNKTVVLSRNVGNFNFYVSSKQFDTATSFVAESGESTTIDVLAEYLWQYRGYNALGDTLLDALLVLSNWPQGVAFEEPELSTDEPDRAVTYRLSVTINTNGANDSLDGGNVADSAYGTYGIQCGEFSSYVSLMCSRDFLLNKSVTLTATPAPGYVFSGWSGGCTDTTTTCTITMTSSKTVTAKFTVATKYGLAIAVSPTLNSGKVISSVGGINCGNGGTVCNSNLGGNVTLTATPTPGYSFKEWSGACTGTAATCTVSMTAAKSVTATFIENSYSLTVSTTIDKGAVSPFIKGAPVIENFPTFVYSGGNYVYATSVINCGGNYMYACSYLFPRDSKVRLKMTIPDSQYVFSAWGGACAGKAQDDCTVSMTAAQTVTAAFVRNMLNIYVQPTNGSAGTVTVSGLSCLALSSSYQRCLGSQSFGKTVTLTATPKSGYRFTGWSGACSGMTNSCTVVMNGPKTVFANFAQ